MLIFIYYYKGILSISDIQTVLKPVTDSFFGKEDGFKLEDVYNEVFSLEKEEVDFLKKDVIRKYDKAQETFQDARKGPGISPHLFLYLHAQLRCLCQKTAHRKADRHLRPRARGKRPPFQTPESVAVWPISACPDMGWAEI